jgi:uncharacterized membrane protein
MERLEHYLSLAGFAIEGGGVLVIVSGCLASIVWFVKKWRESAISTAYHECREVLGRSILLGLEFLVAGDIIRTVVAPHSLTSVLVLAVIVLIRTFLSMTLQLEMDGRWPWQDPPRQKP